MGSMNRWLAGLLLYTTNDVCLVFRFFLANDLGIVGNVYSIITHLNRSFTLTTFFPFGLFLFNILLVFCLVVNIVWYFYVTFSFVYFWKLQLVSGLGWALYEALDYGCKQEEQNVLSPDLEQMIDFLTSAGKFSIFVSLSLNRNLCIVWNSRRPLQLGSFLKVTYFADTSLFEKRTWDIDEVSPHFSRLFLFKNLFDVKRTLPDEIRIEEFSALMNFFGFLV